MSLRQRILAEIRSILLTTLYFGVWIGMLLLLKTLILDEYQVEFHRWSLAVIGALVMSKVVLVLEHVPLGKWVRERPAIVDVALRTGLYASGVFVVLVLEHAFEGRHEHGGFVPSLENVFAKAETSHVVANTIALGGALLVYNVFSLIHGHLGEGGLVRLFLSPPPPPPDGAD